VVGTGVAPLPVDDHGTREDEPLHAAAGHRGEQHRGAELVGADVERQVLQIEPEPDDGGLVAHHVDAVQSAVGQSAHVRPQPLGPPVEVVRPPARVHVGQQGVEDEDLVPCVEECGRDVAAHEAGAAGEQDAHQRRLRRRA
jgi:hypothetical protein